MPATKDEVYKKVQTALVDALGVDEEEVTPQATMVGDLGAESIDFLDIVFKLEKAFGIEIPRKELSPEDILTNADFVKDVNATPAGIVELKRRMTFVDCAEFESHPQGRAFSYLLMVGHLVKAVDRNVGA